jgi:4-hydroxy-tetrahydrodipicolinate synthase
MSTDTFFHGLSAFPLTPTDGSGRVDTKVLCRLVERLCEAGVDSIGLLGSTGIYVYLSREERQRAIAAAAECVRGKVPLIVGVGALRTDQSHALAQDAEAEGADALLLAPVSYAPLSQDEVYEHFRTVAATTDLPLCIYNNPGTTHFTFGTDLLERLSEIETVRAIKMPLPADGDFACELPTLWSRTGLSVGYSGDWGMAAAMLAGADAFYSVLAGMLPRTALSLVRAAQAGDVEEVGRIDKMLMPLWETFKAYGSIRVMYALLTILEIGKAAPPRPILPLGSEAHRQIESAIEALRSEPMA